MERRSKQQTLSLKNNGRKTAAGAAMIKKTAIFLATCAALALSAGAPRSSMPDTLSGGKYVSEGGYFKCLLPKDWRKVSPAGQTASEKKIYGVDVTGPSGADGIAPSISVKYYDKGNTLFKSSGEFVRIHSRPIAGLGLPGDKYSSVATIKIAGRTASKFERNKSDFTKPRQLKNKAIPVFERYIVMPAGEGFYVLSYYCVFSEAKAKLPAFEGVVRSFEPLVN
jgi:hypothetical protein